jgi:hypothetical protein
MVGFMGLSSYRLLDAPGAHLASSACTGDSAELYNYRARSGTQENLCTFAVAGPGEAAHALRYTCFLWLRRRKPFTWKLSAAR